MLFRLKVAHGILALCLVVGGLAGLWTGRAAAQDEPATTTPSLHMSSQFPVLRGPSGNNFEFQVDMNYTGTQSMRFSLNIDTPPDWSSTIKQSYANTEIGAIVLEPNKTYPDNIKVDFFPSAGKQPEPGEYTLTLHAASGDITDSIELKAVVTARYGFSMSSATGRLNTEANSGEDNAFAIRLLNSGSAPLENITFAANKPDGWDVTFDPKTVDSIDPGTIQDVSVNINPPRKTIAGDYIVTIRANGTEVADTMDIRVTVLTPSIWGWVGVLIVLVVIAGLAVTFWRLGRR